MGNDESHFNLSLIVRDKVTRPQTTTFEEKGELKQVWTEVPLLTSQAKPAHKCDVYFVGFNILRCHASIKYEI